MDINVIEKIECRRRYKDDDSDDDNDEAFSSIIFGRIKEEQESYR
mgnify:CR=1 FL=1